MPDTNFDSPFDSLDSDAEVQRQLRTLRFLVQLDDQLRPLVAPAEIVQTVATTLGTHLGVDRCAYAWYEDDEETFHIPGDYTRDVPSIHGTYGNHDFGLRFVDLMRRDLPYVVHDTDHDVPEENRASYYALQIQSVICVPLQKKGKLVAVMAVHQKVPRIWTEDEVKLLQMSAARCWESLERTRIGEELRASEERFRILSDYSPVGIFRSDAEGNAVYVNRAWCHIWGVAEGEVKAGRWSHVIHEEDRDRVRAEWHEAVEAERPFEMNFRVNREPEGTAWLQVVAAPLLPWQNGLTGYVGIVLDITDVKSVNQELVRQKEQLEMVNDLGVSIASERDVNALVQKVTDAGRTVVGAAFGAFFYNVTDEKGERYTLYTLSGAPREAFEKFSMPRKTEIFAPTFDGKGVVRIDDVKADPRYGKMGPHHGMPPGHLPVRSYLAVPVVSRTGEVLGGLFFGHPEPGRFTAEGESTLVGMAAQAAIAIDNAQLYTALEREISSLQATQGALRESEQFNANIVNSTADCIYVLDLEGCVVSVNQPGVAMLELRSAEAVKGRPWVETWPETVQSFVQKSIDGGRRGEVSRFQGPSLTASGMEKYWDVIISPVLGADGKVVRLTATARDFTEARRTQEGMRAAQQAAEHQSRIKDEFLATLSHELRTPLQSILGWTQILIGGDLEEGELEQGLEVIHRNAQAQTRIIEDLLDMSRILSGKVRLDVQKIELGSVIEAAVESIKPAAAAKSIRLHSVIDPLAKAVSGDPNRLQQVFWNLLSNAIKFTPTGGRVQVVLERVNSHLEVTVSDTGIGIDPEFLPHVFERFRQADGSTTRNQGGLGLGLAIVKHLTELHGGAVRVKSGGPAKGATFTVMLPLAVIHSEFHEGERRHPEMGPAERKPVPLPDLSGVDVLVVDDEFDARFLVQRTLTKAGATVRGASSVVQALQLIEERVPTVLVSDIGMPQQDGYALIQALRALPSERGGNLPAIALTAYTRSEDRIKVISAGFQMHIAKPADSVELLTMVKSLVRV